MRTGILEVAYNEPVPTQPSEFATTKELSPDFKLLETKVRELFEKRPVWTRLALAAQLNIAGSFFLFYELIWVVQPLNRILPRVAFYYRSGPWRKTWVKLGFDPKIHPEAKL